MIVYCQFSVGCSLFLLANTAAFLGLPEFFNFKNWIFCYFFGTWKVFLWCSIYFLWVKILEQPYPMPFIGIPGALFTNCIIIVIIWFSFPKLWRKNQLFKQRAKYLVFSQLWLQGVLTNAYIFLMFILYFIPLNLQWIMALIMQVVRETGAFALSKLLKRATPCDNNSGDILASHLGIVLFIYIYTVY